jgi:hypothetical protein
VWVLAEVMRCVWALAEVMPSEVCVGTRRGHAIGGVCEDSLRSEVCAGTSRGHAIGCVCALAEESMLLARSAQLLDWGLLLGEVGGLGG